MEKHLIAVAYNVPPLFYIVPDGGGNLTFSGLSVDIFSWLSAFLNFQITYALVDPFQVQLYGALKTGINQLLNNESDIFFTALVPTLERMKLMDFTHPVTSGDFRFMLPYSDVAKGHVTAILEINTPQVWATTIAIYFVMSIFISAFQYQDLTSISKSSIISIIEFVGRRILYSVTIFSGRSGSGNYFIMPYNTRFAVRLAVATWILMTAIFLAFYTTFLTSYLTVPKFNPIVNSLYELAASHEYKLVEPLDADMGELFLNAETEPFKTLGESLRNQKPSLTLANLTESLNDVLLEINGAYAQDVGIIQYRIEEDVKRNGRRCRFTASKILEFHKPYPIALRKGDPNVDLINKGLIRLKENGLLDHWTSYKHSIDKCMIKEKSSLMEETRNFTAMNISHQIGTFLIIAIGFAFSFLSFICELIFFKRTMVKLQS